MTSYINALNCPNCGAPLELSEDQALVRCRYCGSRIERSDEAPTWDDQSHILPTSFADGQITIKQTSQARHFVIKMQGGRPIIIEDAQTIPRASTSVSYFKPPRRAAQPQPGKWVGCLITVFILLVTVVPVGLALGGPQVGRVLKLALSGKPDEARLAASNLGKIIRVGGSGALAPAGSDGPPDIIALAMYIPTGAGESQYRLAALRSAEPVMFWQSEPLGKNVYRATLLANADFVYVLVENRLLALQRADGKTAWNITLADQVSLNICPGCVRLADRRLFTLSDDGTLQAYDAQTGQSVWNFRANQDSPRGLYLLDGRPAFLDQDEDNHGILRVFDPASGKMQIVQPACQRNTSYASYASWTTPIYVSPDGSSFYLFFDECAQRWDARTSSPIWNAQAPERSYDNVPPLITEEALYMGLRDKLVALDAADGQAQTLLQDKDYEFVPLAVKGDLLLVRATRTRGSRRYEVWAIDATSGRPRWKIDLGQSPPLDPPDASSGSIDEDKPAWTWRITSKGLAILRFKAAQDDVSHAIVLETFNLQTGASSGQQEIRLGVDTIILSAPGFTLWQRDTAWMSIEGQLLGLDAANGKIVYRWP